jgi:hypothetical protein
MYCIIVVAVRILIFISGVSCFFGLAVILLFLPLNHFAGTIFVGTQENLMKARDERVALMNEILGAIRMLKVREEILSSYRFLLNTRTVHGLGTKL